MGHELEKEEPFQQIVLELLDIWMQNKNNFDSYLKPHKKIKQLTDLNVKRRTTKLLEENIGENLCGVGLGKVFFDKVSKSWSIKEQISIRSPSALQKTLSKFKQPATN